MCLDTINESRTQQIKDDKKDVIAYKIVEKYSYKEKDKDGIQYFPPFITDVHEFNIGENVSPFQKKALLPLKEKGYYPIGFHSFIFVQDAFKYKDFNSVLNDHFIGKQYIVIKVTIKTEDILCIGEQDSLPVIVSKKIIINSFEEIEHEAKENG